MEIKDLTQYATEFEGIYLYIRNEKINPLYYFRCKNGHTFLLNKASFEKRHWCRKCKKELKEIQSNQIKTLISNLESPDSKSACKVLQCDPSVHYLQTTINSYFANLNDDLDAIIKFDRAFNKLLHKYNIYVKPSLIAAISFYLYARKINLLLSNIQIHHTFKVAKTSINVTLIRILGKIEHKNINMNKYATLISRIDQFLS